jgi:AcrR family transcriptional regulator
MHGTGATQKRQRNQRGEGARLKDELIEAAMRLLDRSPNAQLSLRMVAKEAGIAAPSVYRHFADVNAMMAEFIRVCWSQMGEHLNAATKDLEPAEPLDALKAKMAAFVRYAMDRPSRYQLLFAPSYRPEHDLDGPLRPAFRQVRESVEAIAASGAKLPARDAFTSALMLISLAHGRIALAHLAPQRQGNFAPDVEAFVLETLDLLFAA